jgi:hypothetical protein
MVADERHGIVLDWQTHEYLHRTRGAAIANGFGASNYILNGAGNLNTHIQLDIASGTFFDEDLQVDVVSTNTPTANTWEQDLTGPSQIPIFYLSGTTGWVRDNPTTFPLKRGSVRPVYNLNTAGTWSTPDIDNNKFGATFIIATNNINYPVMGVISQTQHANQSDAEAINWSDLNLTGFPIVEFRPLYKIVYQTKTSFSNTPKATIVSVWDLRSFDSVISSAASFVDANALSGTVLAPSVVTSSLTSVGTLTSLSSGAITTTGTLAVNASGGITTDQTTFLLINSSATTVTAFGAATTINLGYTNSVAFSNTFNIATNAQEFGTKTVNIGTGSSITGATYVNIGSTLGTSYVTVNGTLTATLTGNASTATKLATARAINGVNFDGSAAITVTADAGTLSGSTLASGVTASSLTSVGTLTGVTSNAATAFIAGSAAESGVALQMPREGALRNLTNGLTNMYFDVSIGGTTQGQFQFRSSSSFTNVLTMSPTAFNVNPDATVTARTPSLARTAFNSAIDTELTVDEMRFRISNQGGIFPQVIGNTSTRNLAWTVVAARSGSAVTQAGSTGTLVASNAWTSLYTLGGMDSAGDTYTATLQDKALSRIYRVTFMRSDNGSTTGYNIIAERLL